MASFRQKRFFWTGAGKLFDSGQLFDGLIEAFLDVAFVAAEVTLVGEAVRGRGLPRRGFDVGSVRPAALLRFTSTLTDSILTCRWTSRRSSSGISSAEAPLTS
jgi:hypothetical protein